MKKVIIILLVFLIISCSKRELGLEKIGNGYFLTHSINGYIMICNKADFLGPDTYSIVIGEHILEYAYDSNYIFAINKPRDSISGINNTKNYDELVTLFKKSDFKQYWILKKQNDSLYGPYKFKQFELEIKKLKILKNIVWKSTKKWDHNNKF